MVEPVEITSEELVKEVGLLHMEAKKRAAREVVLGAENEQLRTLVAQLQQPKKAKKR
jgi:hypothetical protein